MNGICRTWSITQRLAKPASSAAAAMAPSRVRQRRRSALPRERRDLQPEAQRQRVVALAGGGERRRHEGRRHDLDVGRLVHAVEALVGQRRRAPSSKARRWLVTTFAGSGGWR